MQNASMGLLMSAAAGAATVVGAVISVFLRPSRRANAVCLGFASGVMTTVSLCDLIPEAVKSSLYIFGRTGGTAVVVLSLSAGMGVSLFLEQLFPFERQDEMLRLGLLSAAALMLHNFPEGAAVFAGASSDISLGASIAGAIALHNIPEGISVAMPVFSSTKSRAKAIGAAAVSGLSEPLGALITLILTGGRIDEGTLCVIFSAVAGLMVCLSFSELLPEALSKSQSSALLGALFGVFVMVLSVCVF